MASTPQGRRLTEEHRRAQVGLRARFLTSFLGLWPLLDWARVDETTPGWVQAVMSLLRPARQESADLAVRYYRDYRLVEVPATPVPAPEVEFVQSAPQSLTSGRLLEELDRRRRLDVEAARRVLPEGPRQPITQRERRPAKATIDWSAWDKAAEKSLSVTGPGELKRQAKRGVIEVTARRNALVASSGAASRHVLTGGRETQMELIRADDVVKGYIRVTDEDPCAFCAMLASRGIVFKEKSFSQVNRRTGVPFASRAEFEGLSRNEAKVHDRCACQIEAVLVRNAYVWPGRAREFRRLWDDNIAGKYSGKDAISAWRRLYDAQRREQGTAQPLSA